MSKQIYCNLVEYVLTNPFCSLDELCERFGNKYFDIREISLKGLIENLSSSKRITMLSSISDLGLTIYGNTGWSYHNSDEWHLPLCYDSRKVYSLEQQQRENIDGKGQAKEAQPVIFRLPEEAGGCGIHPHIKEPGQ